MTNRAHHKARHTARVQRGCGRKVTYHSEESALRAALRTTTTWYHCPHCGHWHLTSQKDPKGTP